MGTAGIAAGLVCGVAAAACFELGYVAQAADARRVEGDRLGLLLRLARRRSWLGGSALVVCGLLLQLLALYLAPLSVVQPALVLGLGLLVVLAERRLGERLAPHGRLAVAAAALGVLLIALGGESAGTTAAAHPVPVLGAFAILVVIVLAAAAGWGAAAAVAGLLALDAEMTGLQKVPATIAGPLVLVSSAAIPVLLAPVAVGERWASPAVVLAGLAFVVAAAAMLGAARVAQG